MSASLAHGKLSYFRLQSPFNPLQTKAITKSCPLCWNVVKPVKLDDKDADENDVAFFAQARVVVVSFCLSSAFSTMSQSPLEREILYDQEYQARHADADEIRKGIEKQMENWQAVLREAEKKILELRGELVRARKNVEEIEADRRRPCVVSVVEDEGENQTVARMLCKLEEAIKTIDEMGRADIDVPDSIVMHLESLIALPNHARSDVAASAYKQLLLHVKNTGLPQEQFAQLDKQVVDVVTLAMGRFIDATDKGEWRKEMTLTFGAAVGPELGSKIGNSWYQMFKRDFIANPMKAHGSISVKGERGPRSRPRQQPRHKRTRCISEPISESRSMTGSAVRFQ